MEEAFEQGQGPHRAVEPVMMMMMVMMVFRVVTPYCLVHGYQRFGGIYLFHLLASETFVTMYKTRKYNLEHQNHFRGRENHINFVSTKSFSSE
jgi:hypothetical protein